MVDSSGNIINSYKYNIYGNIKEANESGIENPIRYAGQYYDDESGLYYLKARYYDPGLMRFISEDVYKGDVKDPLSLNLYVYCAGNPVAYIDQTGNQPEWAAKITSAYKGTSFYQLLHWKTMFGENPDLFYLFGFVRDKDGIYHARQDGWQQHFGYNKFYDFMFDLGTDMDYKIFPFSAGNEQFRLWLWKGDYLNLGAGAEAGIYYSGGPHWLAGTEYAMYMSLSLYDNQGNQIFNWIPNEKNWWITGFNPYYQDAKASNLTIYFNINFSDNLEMWNAFYEKYGDYPNWKFNKEKHFEGYKWYTIP